MEDIIYILIVVRKENPLPVQYFFFYKFFFIPGLVCFGVPNAFPSPSDALPEFEEGVSFNLWNNIWNTNYIVYYPFNAEDANIKYRWTLNLDTF